MADSPQVMVEYYKREKREKILAMPAGIELDALVGEKVMGWVDLWTDGEHYMMYPPSEQKLGVGYDERHPIPPYSTDISVAWEVVEKMQSDRYLFGCCNVFSNGEYRQEAEFRAVESE